MNIYGIIAAMQEEINEIENIMKNTKSIEIFGLTFVNGIINKS